MSAAAAPILLRLPFLYPLAGALALLAHPDILARALAYTALQLCLPFYWLSSRLSEKHHERVFADLYARRTAGRAGTAAGASAAAASQPAPLSSSQAAALAAVDAVTAAAATPADSGTAAAGSPANHPPLVAALLFLIRPPPTAAGWAVSTARRAVAAPLGLAFPALPRVAAVLSTGHLGSAWMAPLQYFSARSYLPSWK